MSTQTLTSVLDDSGQRAAGLSEAKVAPFVGRAASGLGRPQKRWPITGRDLWDPGVFRRLDNCLPSSGRHGKMLRRKSLF
jgi:hypothetical protein